MEYSIDPSESVSTAIVRAVSAIEGRDPCAIRELGGVLDPDAVDSLFEPKYDGTPRRGGELSFVYSESRVVVENGEFLDVELLEAEAERNVAPKRADGRSA